MPGPFEAGESEGRLLNRAIPPPSLGVARWVSMGFLFLAAIQIVVPSGEIGAFARSERARAPAASRKEDGVAALRQAQKGKTGRAAGNKEPHLESFVSGWWSVRVWEVIRGSTGVCLPTKTDRCCA